MKFCPKSRPFKDIHEMNEKIVENWNNTIVGYDDLVYILGDVSFGKLEPTVGFLNRLNGRKILIEGNHDQKLLKEQSFRDCFEEIHKYHEITVDGTICVLCHYPIAEWNRMHRGAVHFYGHLHGNPRPVGVTGRLHDVCLDTAPGFKPYEIRSLINQVLKQPIRNHGNSSENM